MRMYTPYAALVASMLFAVSTAAVAQAAPYPSSFGAATPVERLQTMTGGTDTHVNNITTQESNGTVNDNTARNTYSGGNFVGDNAFGNSAGLSTTIQNSGNNVLIQNNTIVNLRMNP